MDFNTIRQSGFYRLSSIVNSPNKPDGFNCEFGNIIVSRGGDTCVQMAFTYYSPNSFAIRVTGRLDESNERWGEWSIYSSLSYTDIRVETKEKNSVIFASVTDYPNAIPVVVGHSKSRTSTDIISADANDWCVYSDVTQNIVIRMYQIHI